ncbi:uncharacterized protein LOC128219100 [Mya arenaria]|uniref:uncharacterized protein LOC128219100 n=1 Tax=Mya arenaria TaxID=6604 RepID=UPI0022DF6598|nr:uncharacterized protein LOC128219100 [Mya arenaria]
MTSADTEAVSYWAVPKCSKDVERFMRLANYNWSFIKNFSKLGEPLHAVVGKHKFKFGEEQQNAFDLLKQALVNFPVLALPKQTGEFVLDCDASKNAFGAELLQMQNGAEHVVAYGSEALTKEQRRYCTTRKELPGEKHGNADVLSRMPHPGHCNSYVAGVAVEDLLCVMADNQWGSFSREVDVVPMAAQKARVGEGRAFENPVSGSVCQGVGATAALDIGDRAIWGFTLSDLHEAQSADNDLGYIIEWLVNSSSPTERDLFLSSPCAKSYWITKEKFLFIKGVLYRQQDGGEEKVFSDQGSNFESKLFTSLCEVLEIHKARTTPYRPSANGQVERYNRTLMDAIRCYIGDSQDKWNIHLPQIAGALRSAVNRSTGFNANKLMLGREVNTPAYLMFPHTSPARVPADLNEEY